MATAKGKKERVTKNNPTEHEAFIERGRTLTKAQQHPFYHALARLRRNLNNDVRLEGFIKAGVTEIILIADELHSRQFRRHFPLVHIGVGGGKLKVPRPHPLAEWVADRRKEHGVENSRGFMSITAPLGDREREKEVRAKFELLRDTLNNRKSLCALAKVGPCALSVWDPEESCPEPNGHPAILISNHIPGCMPNSDFSIVPLGSRSDAPNGIWGHG